MRVLRRESYRTVPWHNGRGETAEILAVPGVTGAFGWRISMAQVVADGEFSDFPGVDRVLTVIVGRGPALAVGDAPPVILSDQPFAFPGDVPCHATLHVGPIVDLNVMTRRGSGAPRCGTRLRPCAFPEPRIM